MVEGVGGNASAEGVLDSEVAVDALGLLVLIGAPPELSKNSVGGLVLLDLIGAPPEPERGSVGGIVVELDSRTWAGNAFVVLSAEEAEIGFSRPSHREDEEKEETLSPVGI